jgi:hypothetical protein
MIRFIDDRVEMSELKELAKSQFAGELVKAVVDIEQRIMAIGGAMHADEEAFLIERGSKQEFLWGINLRPDDDEFVEFDSMINLRPSQNNRSRSVEDEAIRTKILQIVEELVHE